MSPEGKTPECQLDAHRLCDGPRVIRRENAPRWEAPLMTLRCGCACHRKGRSSRH